MTDREWTFVKKMLLCGPVGFVDLLIDGYKVSLWSKVNDKTLQLEIFFVVNGKMKSEWMLEDCPERRRFFDHVMRFKHMPKYREYWRKDLKFSQKHNIAPGVSDPDEKVHFYLPIWKSFDRLKHHFIKHNQTIELGTEIPFWVLATLDSARIDNLQLVA
jgi:hypothetical protein